MPKASGNVFECGAPHHASQHRLNVTMARLMVPHVSAASSVDPGAPASPTRLSSTIVPCCLHPLQGGTRTWLRRGLRPPGAPPSGVCVSDQPGGRPPCLYL